MTVFKMMGLSEKEADNLSERFKLYENEEIDFQVEMLGLKGEVAYLTYLWALHNARKQGAHTIMQTLQQLGGTKQ